MPLTYSCKTIFSKAIISLHGVDVAQIWTTIQLNLPSLKEQIKSILKKLVIFRASFII